MEDNLTNVLVLLRKLRYILEFYVTMLTIKYLFY